MKNIFFILLFYTSIFAQEFVVKKVTGKVLVQKGVENSFVPIKPGDKLNSDDLVITESNSFIRLNKEGEDFILKANSALGLNYIRKISLNDLLLALAMEDVRNVPLNNESGIEKNTAVYGENLGTNSAEIVAENKLGKMKINGAKQLAKNGFPESAIIVSKDTFRKYPSTKNSFEDRIYFADLLFSLKLYNESLEELNKIEKENLSNSNKNILNAKKKLILSKMNDK